MSPPIEFLHHPSDFYNTLRNRLKSAKNRVCIATLYFGHSEMEQELLEAIPSTVPTDILLDGLRGNRRERTHLTSVETINKFCPHARVAPFVTPHYCGLFKLLPDRINEIVGTQHMKLIVVDNDVIITGANLSDIYFTNRQDRYLIVRGQAGLADELVKVMLNVKSGDKMENIHSREHELSDISVQFSVQHMEPDQVTIELLNQASNAANSSHITVCSPYLNLSADIVKSLRCFPNLSIITAAASANAFHNSEGVSRFIPAAYECMQSELMNQLPHANFFNYVRSGWTFHPKGIWIERRGVPIETIIGSSNFGVRSRVRDLEISFRINCEKNRIVGQQLQAELGNIRQWARPSQYAPKTPLWIKYLSRNFLRSFL